MHRNTEIIRDWTGLSIYAIAKEMGTDPSSFDKKVKNRLNADLILDIARATGADPLQGLRMAGLLPEKTAETVDSLMSEAMRLMKKAQQLQAEIGDTAGQSNVVPIWKNQQPTEEEIIEEANEYPAAAQEHTDPLEEPDNP